MIDRLRNVRDVLAEAVMTTWYDRVHPRPGRALIWALIFAGPAYFVVRLAVHLLEHGVGR